MTPSLNFAGVHSRRRRSPLLSWLLEVLQLALTLALITAGLAFALFVVLGINPLKELVR